mmetsp:Transcript_18460/g.58289  ORF Transcript_18460/g.58289 Transcript_18460/m.58289 type:complete len:265 (-) Transcript_18460:3737-4531(-)
MRTRKYGLRRAAIARHRATTRSSSSTASASALLAPGEVPPGTSTHAGSGRSVAPVLLGADGGAGDGGGGASAMGWEHTERTRPDPSGRPGGGGAAVPSASTAAHTRTRSAPEARAAHCASLGTHVTAPSPSHSPPVHCCVSEAPDCSEAGAGAGTGRTSSTRAPAGPFPSRMPAGAGERASCLALAARAASCSGESAKFHAPALWKVTRGRRGSGSGGGASPAAAPSMPGGPEAWASQHAAPTTPAAEGGGTAPGPQSPPGARR